MIFLNCSIKIGNTAKIAVAWPLGKEYLETSIKFCIGKRVKGLGLTMSNFKIQVIIKAVNNISKEFLRNLFLNIWEKKLLKQTWENLSV
ncbi:MAG: hypothetical protein IH949_13700 [Bacteroidetes bacterium]|nr:hypothetical protein [Bacteroidota bacterium]